MNRRRAAALATVLLAVCAGALPKTAGAGLIAISVPCSGASGGAPGLIAAINQANGGTETTISLEAGCVYTLTQVDNVDNEVGANGLPVVSSTVDIAGHGATITRSTAAGTPGFRIFEVAPNGNLTLENLTVSGGLTAARCNENYGGGIFDLGTVTLRKATLSGNTAADTSGGDCIAQGGGIFVGAGDAVTLDASAVDDNTASSQASIAMGGGMDVEEGFLTILPGSSVSGNVASGASQVSGGGIVAQSLAGPSSIDGAVIDNNSAVSTYTAEGGGLYLAAFQAATITVTRSQIEDNSAAGPAAALGGGVFAGGNVVLLSDTISGNTPSNCWGSTVTRC